MKANLVKTLAVASAFMIAGCGAMLPRRMRAAQNFSTVFNVAGADGISSSDYQKKTLEATFERHREQMKDPKNQKILAEFLAKFDHLKDVSLYAKLKETDRIVDASIRSLPDIAFTGQDDHWLMPVETLAEKTGDCEDHAILKIIVLQYLGVPPESLRLVTISTPTQAHAVLLVSTNEGRIVLDNQDKGAQGQLIAEEEYRRSNNPDKVWGVYKMEF